MPGFQSDLCKVAYARCMCFILHCTILFYQKDAGKLTEDSARPNLTFSGTGVKLRLHYNELAQRTATVWRYLTFGDIRCYTLKKSDECDH